MSSTSGEYGEDYGDAAELEDRVGYRCPPKASQFKPGVSGNRAGRPPNRNSRKAKIQRAAFRKVSIRVTGRARSMMAVEAVIYVIKHQAIEGKAAAIKLRDKLFGIAEPDESNTTPQAFLIARAEMSEEEWWERFGYLANEPSDALTDSTVSANSV